MQRHREYEKYEKTLPVNNLENITNVRKTQMGKPGDQEKMINKNSQKAKIL
jgi:hypothetical protein